MRNISREVHYINRMLKNNRLNDGVLLIWLQLYNKLIHGINRKSNKLIINDNILIETFTDENGMLVNATHSTKKFKYFCKTRQLSQSYGKFCKTLNVCDLMNDHNRVELYRKYCKLN